MGEVLQPEQEERAPVAAGEVEVTTEQPEAAGDELLSTDEISGEYSAPGCVDAKICNSMTVAPLGPDAIEMWRTGCCFLPCFGFLSYARMLAANRYGLVVLVLKESVVALFSNIS